MAALVEGSPEKMLAALEPAMRGSPLDAPSFGRLAAVMQPLWDGRAGPTVAIGDKSLRTDYEGEKDYARVNLKAVLSLNGEDLVLDQDMMTVKLERGWYVTGWANPYWRDVKKQASEREAQARDPVAAAFAAQLDSDEVLPGQYFAPHPGLDGILCSERSCATAMDDRRHVNEGVSIPICSASQLSQNKISEPYCYTSNPPTSGMHGPRPAPFAILRQPASKEALVHNLEHGGVVVWYNTGDAKVIKLLEDVVSDELRSQHLVALTPYADLEPETIALTAWTRLDKFAVRDFSEQRVRKFVERHNKRFNPEGF